jgi:hypothetical protein
MFISAVLNTTKLCLTAAPAACLLFVGIDCYDVSLKFSSSETTAMLSLCLCIAAAVQRSTAACLHGQLAAPVCLRSTAASVLLPSCCHD